MHTRPGPVKRWWLDLIQRRLNRWTLDLARGGHGPFSLVRHVGRKSGRIFETPVILGTAARGLVAELTYGPGVNWYRNIVAGGGWVLHRQQWYRIVAVEPYPAPEGRRAFGRGPRVVLTILRRHEFRLLRVERLAGPPGEDAARA
ncbi:nitroreductase family deazaflavin-dependent oxidoreductase [Microbacterium kyungheense]|uniref:nitroreductase family deazaflavin-dependent oxidoreductase n=1 Tax=Microbacterium kyungheense TaxID=1263636 RepID=UPI0031EBC348